MHKGKRKLRSAPTSLLSIVDLIIGDYLERNKYNPIFFNGGEATVSLEDMMILGGCSDLGDSKQRSLPKSSYIQE
ncbi:hypothetical protein H5410_001710 [Solanum commersonii]|uniref:Uncharacterized protein n=1 Tax=Solanum commersonii TaxID=4109 RepID=A0A9J6AZX9_SOLCO|nr:hypothetical protein H5410_001710 [Solanum commersonii]